MTRSTATDATTRPAHDLRSRKRLERFDGGHVRHSGLRELRLVKNRGIKHAEVELIRSVETIREQRRAFAEAIVEDADAAANHHLRR